MRVNWVRLSIGLLLALVAIIYTVRWNTGAWSMNSTQELTQALLFCSSAIIIALAFERKV